MDDVALARASLARAIEDVQAAIARVRSAQSVEWSSVFAARYRDELWGVGLDLARFSDRLDRARAALA